MESITERNDSIKLDAVQILDSNTIGSHLIINRKDDSLNANSKPKNAIEKLNNVYIYKSKTASPGQLLKVEFIDSNKIKFVFSQSNTNKKIEGYATSIANSDPEVDEGEDGSMYPAIAYNYENKDCYFSIRIGLSNKKIATIVAQGCDSLIFGKVVDLGILKAK